MADRQKPWELHEAVVLLDGLLDIQINNLPRAEVIDRVSHDLRMMAINQGYDIDEVFRNRNGITFQIKSMESAYVGYTVMKPASKLFAETVALYRNFPSEYKKIRKEARAMVDGNNEKKFMNYLASQVSPTLIAEFSSYYADIEAFCLRLNILAKSLFDTTDFETIKRVQKTIEQNKIFRITRKRNYEKIVIACRYYYVYVRDGLYRNDESPDVLNESKVVPIIEISYLRSATEVKIMPVDAPAAFTGVPEILVSFRKKAAVKIFATQKLADVSIEIDGHFYDAKAIDDNFYVVDAMPEIRRAKVYTVNVYACGNRIASDLPLRVKKESGSEKSIL